MLLPWNWGSTSGVSALNPKGSDSSSATHEPLPYGEGHGFMPKVLFGWRSEADKDSRNPRHWSCEMINLPNYLARIVLWLQRLLEWLSVFGMLREKCLALTLNGRRQFRVVKFFGHILPCRERICDVVPQGCLVSIEALIRS